MNIRYIVRFVQTEAMSKHRAGDGGADRPAVRGREDRGGGDQVQPLGAQVPQG